MAEQHERVEDHFDIVFYCDQCARRSGRRRVLAVGDRDRGPGPGTVWPTDGWRLRLARRAGRKVRMTSPYMPLVRSAAGDPDKRRPRERVGPVLQPGGLRWVLIPMKAGLRAAELICYQCPARPRVARAKLVELAVQTEAAGRRDAYV